jgi:hypothetical protein
VPEELLRQVLPPRPASAWSWPQAPCPDAACPEAAIAWSSEAEAAIAWSSEAACAEAATKALPACPEAEAEAEAKTTDAQGAATAQEAVSLSPRQRRGEQELRNGGSACQ